MPIREVITDPDDPRLADYADLKNPERNADELAGRRQIFIAEGELVVRAMRGSAFPLRSVVGTRTRLAAIEDVLAELPVALPVYEVPEPVLHALVGFQFHRGLLGSGSRTAPISAAELMAKSRVLVVLENLTNVENVGAAFRNTAALAGQGAGVLLNQACADPLYRKAIRVSMGHALRIPFARLEAWPEGLDAIHAAGFTRIALTPDPRAVDIRTLTPAQVTRPALLLGAEGPGLSPQAFARADLTVRIPIARGVDSLNVSVAGAVALSHLVEPG